VVAGSAKIGKRIGGLYAVNTLGAVIGILGTGYFLLGLFGIKMTTALAMAVNLLVALLAFMLGRGRTEGDAGASPATASPAEVGAARAISAGEGAPLRERFLCNGP